MPKIRVPTIRKSREKVGNFVKAFPDREKVGKSACLLNKHEKQLGKNSALHHVESNATEADEY